MRLILIRLFGGKHEGRLDSRANLDAHYEVLVVNLGDG